MSAIWGFVHLTVGQLGLGAPNSLFLLVIKSALVPWTL